MKTNLMVVTDTSPNQFLEQAGTLLYRDEATNSLMIGLSENLMRVKVPPKLPPVFLRGIQGTETVTAAIQTPPLNLVITDGSGDQLECLAMHLKNVGMELPGVVGPSEASETFATIWSNLTGSLSTLGMDQKIYKIEKVSRPSVPGDLRLAEPSESDLIAKWFVEFSIESLPPSEQMSLEVGRSKAVRAIDNKLAYVWVVEGNPVSMAHVGRPTKNGISISAVYTPKALRRNGYASAIVAHLSQRMLDSGKKFCVLYTDLANPTSNKIYQNVGYREVSYSKYFLFGVSHT